MEGALRGSTQLVHHIVTTKNEYEEVNKFDISQATPCTQELGTALKILRNGKAPGAYQIKVYMFKADLD